MRRGRPKRPQQPPKRKSWLQRHAAEISIGVVACVLGGVIVLLLEQPLQLRRERSDVRDRRQELLNTALAEVQNNYCLIVVNNSLLRAEMRLISRGDYRRLADVSPIAELYEGYERSLTEIALCSDATWMFSIV